MNEELKNILEKVRNLYMSFGIKSVTMDDIARELSISKKTLYQYIEDKTDLVSKVLDLEMSRQEWQFSELIKSGKNAIEELIEVNKHVNAMLKRYNPATEYDLKKYYPDLFQKFQLIRRKRMYDWLLGNIKKGKKEGFFRKELNEEIICKVQLNRIESTSDNGLFTVSEFTSPKIYTEIMIYHIRGICNNKGLQVLEENLDKMLSED